jgi:hypothetical protein
LKVTSKTFPFNSIIMTCNLEFYGADEISPEFD